MALQVKLKTPHGLELDEAYAKIDFFSYAATANEVLFNVVFYANKQARDEGYAPLPDMVIAGAVQGLDIEGNLREQLYNFIKEEGSAAKEKYGKTETVPYLEGTQEEVDYRVKIQYALFAEAVDI